MATHQTPPSRFAIYLLPAIIGQSMIMGGGYSTGREIVEYAARFGPAGWLAVLGVFIGFSVVCALGFELARVGKAYDYKQWIQLLIGPLWPLFDLLLIVMMLFVIAVMTAAIGSVLQTTVGMPTWIGLVIAFAVVGLLAWKGERLMERFKTIGSVALYIAYISFSLLILMANPVESTPLATSAFLEPEPATTSDVLISALRYVGYNLAVIPPVLFCLYRQKRRSETFASGALTGLFMTIPFALTFLCMMRFWPDPAVMDADVPWLPMLSTLGSSFGGTGLWISIFGVVAGWTLLETAVGSIHALTDRIEHNLDDLPAFLRPASGEFSPRQRAALSVGFLGLALLLAQFGIQDLVASGYGTLAWGFIVLMLVPLLTIGVYRIVFAPNR